MGYIYMLTILQFCMLFYRMPTSMLEYAISNYTQLVRYAALPPARAEVLGVPAGAPQEIQND